MDPWKLEVDSLDDVPEDRHPFYTEHDGKFVLTGPVADLVKSNTALTDTNGKVRRERDAAKSTGKALKEAGYDSVEEMSAKIDELNEQLDGQGDIKEKVQKAREEAERQWKQRAEAAEARADKLEAEADADFLDARIAKAVSGEDTAIPQAASMLLRQKAKVQRDENGNRTAVILDTDGQPMFNSATGGDMDVGSYLGTLKGDEAYEWAFKANPASGGGTGTDTQRAPRTTHAGEKNPWSKEHYNLTEQMRISREDAPKAERLKAAAGA